MTETAIPLSRLRERAVEAERKLRAITAIHWCSPYSEDGPASDGFCPQCDVKWPCDTAVILEPELVRDVV